MSTKTISQHVQKAKQTGTERRLARLGRLQADITTVTAARADGKSKAEALAPLKRRAKKEVA